MSENGHKLEKGAWGRRKRFATGVNVSASVILAIAAAIIANYVSGRHLYLRSDVSRLRFYSLSDKTRTMLRSLTADISVFVVVRPRTPAEEKTAAEILDLLNEYRLFADRLDTVSFRVERVDPDRDLARTEVLQKRYDFSLGDGVVIFESGGRHKVVPMRHIVEYESSGIWRQRHKTAFRGEQAFSSAILSTTQKGRPVAYFVVGHGERSVRDFDMANGYSELARQMQADHIEVRTTSLSERHGIPADCRLLVVAGPRAPLGKAEVSAVRAHLDQNRNVLLLLDAGQSSGLEPLLLEWGVRLSGDRAVDELPGISLGTGDQLYVERYGHHDITERLAGIRTLFCVPRSVVPAKTSGEPSIHRVTVLAESSEHGWAESDFDQDPPRFDAGADRQGPIPVAVAVERGVSDSVRAELQPTRMVIVGDSDFASNGYINSGGNRDFLMSAIHWLVGRPMLMAIGPKTYGTQSLGIDDSQVRGLFLAIVLGLPAAVACFGVVVWLKRVR